MYYGVVMYKKYRIFCAKPISTTRFSFSPSICYVNQAVKNQLFPYTSYRAEIWWVDSRHQVDTNDTPYRGHTP